MPQVLLDFFTYNIFTQLFVGFIFVFIAFAIVITIKNKLLPKIENPLLAKLVKYTFGILFVGLFDVPYNIIYLLLVYGEAANAHGEGWLITDRLKYHNAQPGIYWQKRVSIFICDYFVNKVDENHCGTRNNSLTKNI